MDDTDFNEFDDPEEIQKVISSSYDKTNLSEFANKLYDSLGISTEGDLDDPDNLDEIRWDAPKISKVSVSPFSFRLDFILSAEVNQKIIENSEEIESEILHCLEFDSQLPEHNVTLNYFESHEINEISEKEYNKIFDEW
tara:strand:- start:476 stop:892 length:417 start_codon:yes stop_codon:yes gene_type:complete